MSSYRTKGLVKANAGTDRPDKAYFMDNEIDQANRSARGWIIGEGHVSVAEARQRALARLADAEAKLADHDAELAEAAKNFNAAKLHRDRVYERRQTARYDVKQAQSHLAYVCSTDSPPLDDPPETGD